MESTRITTLNSFIDWVTELSPRRYLFRGLSNAKHCIEASAWRRLTDKRNKDSLEKFLEINTGLIRDARRYGHDQRNGRKLSDLEMLAELQHFRTATFLIDFTYSPEVALWFACQSSTRESADGKVSAVLENADRIKEITPELQTEDIDSFFETDEEGNYYLHRWQPTQLNNRIFSQSSVFLFGGDRVIEPDRECIIAAERKQKILASLEDFSQTTEAKLFPDFDGFVRQRTHDRPYDIPTVDYRDYADRAYQKGSYEEAINYYSEAIHQEPAEASLYRSRGNTRFKLELYDEAISDFDEAISRDPNDKEAYELRGGAHYHLGNSTEAAEDFQKAIELADQTDDDASRANAQTELSSIDLVIKENAARIRDAATDWTPQRFKESIPEKLRDRYEEYDRRGDLYRLGAELERFIQERGWRLDRRFGVKHIFYLVVDTRLFGFNLFSSYPRFTFCGITEEEGTSVIPGLGFTPYPQYSQLVCHRGLTVEDLRDLFEFVHDKAIQDYDSVINLNSEPAKVYYNRGTAYSAKGELDKAIQDYSKAIELNPEYSEAYANRGIVYNLKGELDKAIQDYSKAIGLNPENAKVYYSRGTAYSTKGDLDKAIQDYNKAIGLNPEYSEAYANRGAAYGANRELDKAIRDCSKAIELNPELTEAYKNRSVAYKDKGDLDAAIEDYSKLIALAPEDASVYNNRGNAYGNKGDFDSAIEDYSEAIALAPEDASVYNNRGIAYHSTGDFDSAIQDYSEAIALAPEDASVYRNRGNAYGARDEFDRAIRDYSKAISLNPEDANVYSIRGLAYGAKGDLESAIRDYSKAISLNPEDVGVYYNRGNAYHSTGDFDSAIEDFSEAIALAPEDARLYSDRGNAYYMTGDFEAAIRDYSRAIDLNPKNAGVYYNRGNAYHITGDFEAAIEDFSKTIALAPEDAGVYNNRGVTYRDKDDFGAAIEDYNEAIDLHPKYARAYSNRGVGWLHLKEWQKAKVDLMTAKEMGVDIIESFHNVYESVEVFEAINGVEVPEDIAALLQ